MREVAKLIVGQGFTKGDSKSHFARLHHKPQLVDGLKQGLWNVAVTNRGKARKSRAKSRRSDGRRGVNDDIQARKICRLSFDLTQDRHDGDDSK
jgi:hypothetical protein